MRSGETLGGRFAIERLAGTGGMGSVWEARDLETGERVAIKTLTVEHPSAAARFAREAELLRAMTHPAIVRHVAHGVAEGHMRARKGSVHFMYDVYQIGRQHYVRANALSGAVEKNIFPSWRGGNSELHAFDGFFVGDDEGWLFAVGAGDDQRLVILASDDDGETWLDYARSEPMPEGYAIYSVSGSRALSADGHLLGAFTRQQYPNVNDAHLVEFFRVDATRALP